MPYVNGKRITLDEWYALQKTQPFTEDIVDVEETPDAPKFIRRRRRSKTKQVSDAVAAATGITLTADELSLEDEEDN